MHRQRLDRDREECEEVGRGKSSSGWDAKGEGERDGGGRSAKERDRIDLG